MAPAGSGRQSFSLFLLLSYSQHDDRFLVLAPNPSVSLSSQQTTTSIENQQIVVDDQLEYDDEYYSEMAAFNRQQGNGSETRSIVGGNFTDDDSNFSDKARTNLIINYLPQTMTQDEIKDLFGSIGAVESYRRVEIIANAAASAAAKKKRSRYGQSLGYGFVNFIRLEDAEKAVTTMNGLRLQNKTIKVSFARPSSESIKFSNLYISNLPRSMTQQELESLFADFGCIISSKILCNPKAGASKSVGFIRFDQRSEAEMAISKLNGTIPKGFTEPITVKFANTPNAAKSMIGLPLAPSYLPGLSASQQPVLTTAPPMRQQMNRYSPLSPADFFAAATASYLPAAAAAVSTTTLTPSTDIASVGWCIFVYNLAPETDENILWQLFGPFGAVQNVKIIRDFQTQKCKGFGFVTMSNYDEALMAINSLNGFTLANRVLQVSFKTNRPMPIRAF
ncbi:unnamed protein product [Rotaria socialis]|uniref:RRM domain-containing protein n=2 Tax=Rotaria TaxID=231623 RepID=A0A820W678_9BILA|nr:unnamed protein product [Rotaria socialis]CAF4307779.1 unnamed protein product [Rotaria socialis]CAF4502992.1 unnamed protein product [Rotaria socialis]CAF4509988.1 unnamed protein product [Rotaria socialis]